jgi:hypothetical protein
MSRATDRDFEAFGSEFKDFLSVALSNSLKRIVHDLDKEIAISVKKAFWFPGDPSRLAVKAFSTKGAKVSSANLTYRFEAVSLSKYPMKQIRVTTGNSRIKVSRGGGLSKGNKFTIAPTPISEVVTQFKFRKSDPWRTVEGRVGFKNKGFLHTGRKGSFSSAVFERVHASIKKGGRGGRYPIHRLYGASLVYILRTKELKTLFEETKIFDKFEKAYIKSISQR